jgi:hypothetical protein
MMTPFFDFYRCPEDAACFTVARDLPSGEEYFRFGEDAVCFGQCALGHSSRLPNHELHDSFRDVRFNHASVRLPFDLEQVIDNLRFERYMPRSNSGAARMVRGGYYCVRPLLSVAVRKHLQKLFLRGWEKLPFPQWPVDTTVEQVLEQLLALTLEARQVESIPFIWFWPEGASNCVMMTHDVETAAGVTFCSRLMDIDDEWGIRASYQIVPEERYKVTPDFLDSIRRRGFEVNIQDLNHDGRLFNNRDNFLVRAKSINRYVHAYGAKGFRAAVMYRKPDWYKALDICYDMSIPNSAHLEPQRGGCCTVFPYFIGSILEIPLTTTQDYSLFHILGDYSIELWKRQIELIQEKHGLISFIVHPDYIIPKRARGVYRALLDYLSRLKSDQNCWLALAGEVNDWWRARARMRLVMKHGQWTVEGPGSERARVAFARSENGCVSYTIANPSDSLQPCSAALSV